MEEATKNILVSSPQGVFAILVAVCAFWFYVEQKTKWKLFEYIPPLLFIYLTPVLLNNVVIAGWSAIPTASPVYDVLKGFALPMMLCLLLLSIDVGAAVRIMGKGVIVMLIGTLGIMVGGMVAYFIVHRWLEPDAWMGFGALAGSWIGGTGNMAGAADALGTSPEQLGLAVLADNVVYIVWLPILLGSKSLADRFNRWARVDKGRLAAMEAAADREAKEELPPQMRQYLYLGVLAAAVTWLATSVAPKLPEVRIWLEEPVLTASVWKILIISTLGIMLSFTNARHLPGSHNVAMAIVYVFVAGMGARASLAGLAQAPVFLLGAFIWIFIHGAFCLAGAYALRVDVHTVAIASAANVGGAASAPVVAAAHREKLVPVSILMALIGYAVGNFAAIATGYLCLWVGGG
ncbi:MAG: DUF819 family protein [bacterium]|nr:DUF819 family protein [bacterium]